MAFANRYLGQSVTQLGILSASGDLGGRVDADSLGLVLLGGDGISGGLGDRGTDSTSSDGLGVRDNGLVDLLVSDDRGSGILLDSLVGGGSGVLLLGLDAVQGLAGTATKVAEHGLALVGGRGASRGGGLGSLGLLNSLGGGRGNDGSNFSGGLLNLNGLSGNNLVLGGNDRGGGLSLVLLGGRRAGAALTLVHEGQTGKEVLLLLAGSGGLSLGGLSSGLSDSRGGGVSDRRGHGSLNRLGGGGLGQLRSGVRDSGVLGRDLRLEVKLLLLGGRLQATPGTGNAAEDAATLADLGLLLGGGRLGGGNRGDGKSLNRLLLSGDGHDCEMVSVCARDVGSS